VVVPTRESGRRLREALVEKAAVSGQGAILGPRMATPEDFFRSDTVMPDSIRWAGWLTVLRRTPNESVSALFPGGIDRKDDGWLLGIARQIEQARDALVAGDADFTKLAALLPEEHKRFDELIRLERQVVAEWKRWGYDDPVAAKRDRALNFTVPSGVDEVVVAGIADPTLLALQAWRQLLKKGIRFTMLIGAPPVLHTTFDEWGRPKPEFWTDRDQQATPEPTTICLAADASGLADEVVRACLGKSSRDVAIGICNSTFISTVSRCFHEAGWATFDPRGTELARDGWPELLEAIAGALESPNDYAAVSRVARHPVIWSEWLKDSHEQAVFEALGKWEWRNGATDATLAMRRLLVDDPPAGVLMRQIHQRVIAAREGASELLEEKLREWFGADPAVADQARSEMRAWRHIDSHEYSLPLRLRWLSATLSLLRQSHDLDRTALPLQGWLELLYDPAPHLVLAAMHEGSVPEAPASHPLVTDVVREILGLRDRKSRLAREVFLYTAMVESRRAHGSVTVINAQADPRGEPCKPSRVLLQAGTRDLPRRVLAFIREKPDVPRQPTPAWARGEWRLRPPPDARPNKKWEHLSPSAIKAYLNCPARFYFTRVLGWEELERFGQELDGAQYGELIHNVLRQWGENTEAREFADATQLTRFWLAQLKQGVEEQFGKNVPPLIQLQVMSARERLMALAEKQAQQRKEGWQIVEVEKEYNGVLSLAGIPLIMRVDRVDRHDDGRLRVIDYKTGRATPDPRKAHLRTWTEEKCPEALGPLVDIRGKPSGWADLQLPLYALTVEKQFNLNSPPSAFYVLLPEATANTAFVEFEGLGAVIDSARLWAEEAARRIRDGVFWPPAPEIKFDPLAAMAPEGLEKALGDAWADFLAGTRTKDGGPSA